MSEPFLGQIEIFPYNFIPKSWLACQGQTLQIAQYQALFALLGTTYGGDGRTTFALPDLRGRLTMGQGAGTNLTPRAIGQKMGEETHTIVLGETPTHNHTLNTAPNAPATENQSVPSPALTLGSGTQTGIGQTTPFTLFAPAAGATMNALDPAAISTTPGGQPHSNLMPYLAMQLCIATSGVFPQRN